MSIFIVKCITSILFSRLFWFPSVNNNFGLCVVCSRGGVLTSQSLLPFPTNQALIYSLPRVFTIIMTIIMTIIIIIIIIIYYYTCFVYLLEVDDDRVEAQYSCTYNRCFGLQSSAMARVQSNLTTCVASINMSIDFDGFAAASITGP